ncbi:DUF6285 domain-containing protein [Paraburkholderia flagellata]|uniref:DUF6285 domain-containing protein n=1 Tax=Paraburkholderia flagellata TaxID=2883241 RepID=UPI001F444D77|nr:DUF6285 domain-containing protein [Paraburkholderia flagellata]
MLNSPNAAQLLEAVSDFLRHEALPTLSGAIAYKTRVAAGAIDIVRRELAHTPGAQRAELQALHAITGRGDNRLEALYRTLCERIADDSMDLSTPGLAPFLWQLTLDKLAIDQPEYDTYRKVISDKKMET